MKNYDIGYMAMPGLKGKFVFPKMQGKTPIYIERMVCEYFGEDYYSIRVKSNKHELVMCRYITMFLVRRYTTLSFSKIGKLFETDHSTALKAVKKIGELVQNNDKIREQVRLIEMKII